MTNGFGGFDYDYCTINEPRCTHLLQHCRAFTKPIKKSYIAKLFRASVLEAVKEAKESIHGIFAACQDEVLAPLILPLNPVS